jgi:hypothetical protein
MNPRKLENNQELKEFLLQLGQRVKSLGKDDLAEKLDDAANSATSSSSEYLGDARDALIFVKARLRVSFTPDEIQDIDAVVSQIDAAFRKANGLIQ